MGMVTELMRRKRIITPSLTSFLMSSGIAISSSEACNLSGESTYYHDGIGATPTGADTIYTTPTPISPLIGGDQWWKLGSNAIQINNSGQIITIEPCV